MSKEYTIEVGSGGGGGGGGRIDRIPVDSGMTAAEKAKAAAKAAAVAAGLVAASKGISDNVPTTRVPFLPRHTAGDNTHVNPINGPIAGSHKKKGK